MGLSPREIDRLSLWEFSCAVEAFNRHHGGSENDDLSDTEVDHLWALVKGEG